MKSPRRPPATPTKPESVLQIAGHTVTVRRAVGPVGDEGNLVYGYYLAKEQEIVIDRNLEDMDLVDTYVHEVLEAINAITNFDMPHYVIQTLAALLAQALVSHGTLSAEGIATRVDRVTEDSHATVPAPVPVTGGVRK